uniref:OTU domain-containing protein n=1 Tax=Panagrolaimus davidi TaxID=227884 RepID=A0A914QBH2_9BILA
MATPKPNIPVKPKLSLNQQLANIGLKQYPTAHDHNCFYAALCYCMYGTVQEHARLRHEIMQYIIQNGDEYSQLITGEDGRWDEYIQRQSTVGLGWGGQIELKAFTEMYKVKVTIYSERNRKHLLFFNKIP